MEEKKVKKPTLREGGMPRGKLQATDWLAGVVPASDCDVVQVVFKNTRSGFFRNVDRLDLKIDDIVAVEASPGHDIGRVSMVGPLVRLQMKKAGVRDNEEVKRVFRLATPGDLERFDEARAREHDTMIRSRKIAEELELNMKIGDVEYQGDGAKAIFYYIADERVDFRKLIRILADTFKIRIEMKQIGARQEAGRIGGIGPCGRPLCCSSWMNKFVSVGTGAARLQDLSMNPQKLAGQCAKLKCCLNFEIDAYAEARHKLPSKDITLETQDATYYYFKPDILAGLVTYSTDKNIPANLVTIPARRAFEIIALNRQGIKVENLEENPAEAEKKEFIDLAGQDDLTRFDKSKRKKRKGGSRQDRRENRDSNTDRRLKSEKTDIPEKVEKGEKADKPEGGERPEGGDNRNRRSRQRRGRDNRDNRENRDNRDHRERRSNRVNKENHDGGENA